MNKKSTEKNVDLSMNIADFNSPTTSSQRKVDLQRKKKIIFNNNVKSVKAARVLYVLKQLLFHLSLVQLVSLHVFFSAALFSIESAVAMDHPLFLLGGLILIRNIPKILVIVAVLIVVKSLIRETATAGSFSAAIDRDRLTQIN